MKFVNNILKNENGIIVLQYAPDKLIVRNVLRNKLKCDKIQYDKDTGVLSVFWEKETKNG